MSSDPITEAYVQRRRAAGRSNPEILRLLKRAIVREIYRELTGQAPVADIADLRPARQATSILTAAAQHFGLWPSAISTLERGLRRDDAFTSTYRQWRQAARRPIGASRPGRRSPGGRAATPPRARPEPFRCPTHRAPGAVRTGPVDPRPLPPPACRSTRAIPRPPSRSQRHPGLVVSRPTGPVHASNTGTRSGP